MSQSTAACHQQAQLLGWLVDLIRPSGMDYKARLLAPSTQMVLRRNAGHRVGKYLMLCCNDAESRTPGVLERLVKALYAAACQCTSTSGAQTLRYAKEGRGLRSVQPD